MKQSRFPTGILKVEKLFFVGFDIKNVEPKAKSCFLVLYVLYLLSNMPHIWSSKEFFFAEKMRRILLEIWKKITSNISIWDPTLRKIKACNFKSLQHKLQCQDGVCLPLNHFFIHLSGLELLLRIVQKIL